MINLLSRNHITQLKAARLNIILRRYVALFIFVALLIAAAFGVGYYVLYTEEQRAKQLGAEYEAARVEYADDMKKSQEFTSNLTAAKSILGSEVLFSDVVFAISQSLPAGSVLQSLNLETSTFDKPMTLQLVTTSYEEAVATKDAFENSPYFEKSQILSTRLITDPKDQYDTELSLTVTLTASALSGESR